MIHLLPFLVHAVFAVGVTLLVVSVVTLTLRFLVDWFVQRAALIRASKNKLAMTVAEGIKNGKVSYIQGIFDTAEERFTEGRRIFADRVDEKVKRAHEANPFTIWE
jgi:hypothetical protein